MLKLRLNNVCKVYSKNVAAVTNFNLDIAEREFVVLVGPSGCGKSTVLRMIAGLEEVSGGEIYLGKTLVNNIPSKDRDIAMVFQNYALYPHMTVFENMAFGLKIRKLPKTEITKRVSETAEILGLGDYLKRKPKALSGGQKQRVALGRAIVRDAKVFLMDEPLSNLDAKLRVQMRSEIIKLHSRLKTTTIYVTHDQTEAMTMATKLVVMKDGAIQQVGTPKSIYTNPVNMFVAGFIGTPEINFIGGIVTETHFTFENISIPIPKNKLELLKSNGYVGKEVVMGIRPEEISYIEEKDELFDDLQLIVEIDFSELMGSERMLYTKLGNQNLVVRVDSRINISEKTDAKVTMNMNEALFFDRDSEMQISVT